jgi:hypothetical protein
LDDNPGHFNESEFVSAAKFQCFTNVTFNSTLSPATSAPNMHTNKYLKYELGFGIFGGILCVSIFVYFIKRFFPCDSKAFSQKNSSSPTFEDDDDSSYTNYSQSTITTVESHF